jgi:hypothetical protein
MSSRMMRMETDTAGSQRSPWSWCEAGVVDPAGLSTMVPVHGAHGARVNAYQVEATVLPVCAGSGQVRSGQVYYSAEV